MEPSPFAATSCLAARTHTPTNPRGAEILALTSRSRRATNCGVKDQFREGGIVVENDIGFWVHRVYQATRNEMYRRFKEAGEDVTPEQWAVLIRLWKRDGRSQSELSDATFRDGPTMSRIIDGMETRGYLERREDPNDGRVRLVRLTKRGRDMKRKLVPIVEQIVERLISGVDEEDLVVTRTVLRRMYENMGA